MVVLLVVSSSSYGFPPLKVTGITHIADVGRAKPGNLQFCDPGHLHPRQAVKRCIGPQRRWP